LRRTFPVSPDVGGHHLPGAAALGSPRILVAFTNSYHRLLGFGRRLVQPPSST
jgi:hypothetical protein